MSDTRIKFINIDSPWMLDPGLVRIAEPPAHLSAGELSEQLYRDELDRPYILETDSHRHLHFTHDAVQSSMCLNAPDSLVTAYSRKMMTVLLFNPNPRHIVMIGLGGGSLPKFCYRHLPETQITVVEIDANVIALRDEFYVPKDNERFRIIHEDGAQYIAQLEDTVNVIMVDAFDSIGIAPSLAESDFYAQAASRLTLDGVFVMNLSGDRSRYAAHLAKIRAAFGAHTLIVPVVQDGNLLLLAFKRELPKSITDELESRAKLLQETFDLDFPRFLHRVYNGQWQI